LVRSKIGGRGVPDGNEAGTKANEVEEALAELDTAARGAYADNERILEGDGGFCFREVDHQGWLVQV
jgi:hypothetical protein